MKYGKSNNYIYGTHEDRPEQYCSEDYNDYIVTNSSLPLMSAKYYGAKPVDTIIVSEEITPLSNLKIEVYKLNMRGMLGAQWSADGGWFGELPVFRNTVNPDAICLCCVDTIKGKREGGK